MTTLIFGATGYVGRHLVRRLAADGPVTGFARDEKGADVVRAARGTAMIGTLADEEAIRAALAEHDHILWVAQLLIDAEREYVAKLLGWLAGSGKTFVMTSGTGVLSERTDGDWSENSFAEDEPFVPRAGIAGRVETEDMVRAAGGGGLRTIVIRPPAIWGHGGSPLIGEIHKSVRATGAACYLGRGLNCYSNVHVDDLADLYALALAKAPSSALYHAVSGELNFRALAEAVAGHWGVATRSLDYAQARTVFGPSSTAIMFAASSRTRCPRARAELGWAPQPERLDIHTECGHPGYATAGEGVASWAADAERERR